MLGKQQLTLIVAAFIVILLLRITMVLSGVSQTIILVVSVSLIALLIGLAFFTSYRAERSTTLQQRPSKRFSLCLLGILVAGVVIDKLVREPSDLMFFAGLALMAAAGAWGILARTPKNPESS